MKHSLKRLFIIIVSFLLLPYLFAVDVNINQIAKNLNDMRPEAAVDVLLAIDDYTVIDILREVEEIAAEEGTYSMGSYWLSLMPSEKAAEIQRKMLINPFSKEVIEKEILYFVTINLEGSVELQSVTRKISNNDNTLKRVINDLLLGPNVLEANCMSLIPYGTQLLNVYIIENTAYLSFNDAFESNPYGVEGYIHQLEQIVYTATVFSDVNDVQFLINGNKREYLGNESQYIGEPISRSSFGYKDDLNGSLFVQNSKEINESTEELKSFNGIPFGSTRNIAQKTMENKGWKLESSQTNNLYSSDTYINGTYAGISGSYISLFFFDNLLWQGYVQIKTEDHDSPDRIIDKLQKKYGLIGCQLKDTTKNGMHLKAVEPDNNNWVDIRITVFNENKIWYRYDIRFYSDELYKKQENYKKEEAANNLKLHEDDL